MSVKWAYYNEFDPAAAEWLRQLIKLGEIMDGEVDERSIADVRADDVRGFVRCHFFAGIGGWDLALRRCRWPDGLPVWTGSCPCQPFSCAGRQTGFDDSRDLWSEFFRLVRDCRPQRCFGEQVARAVGFGWLDRLHSDLETAAYACGDAVLGAHSAAADHIRQRLYWMADAEERGSRSQRPTGRKRAQGTDGISGIRESCRMGDAEQQGLEGHAGDGGDVDESGRERSQKIGPAAPSGKSRNFWDAATGHLCRDGRTRRFESGIQPLVAKLPRGVGHCGNPSQPRYVNATAEASKMRLKGYGNAICVETAAMFVAAANDVLAWY